MEEEVDRHNSFVGFKVFNFSGRGSSANKHGIYRKIVLCATLLVCFVPFFFTHSNNGHEHPGSSIEHKNATEVLFAMCCLMFVDSVLDFMFTPLNLLGTVDAVGYLKITLLCALFFPTLALLLFQTILDSPHSDGIIHGVVVGQAYVITSTLFLTLNFHDGLIWTWQRTNALLFIEIVCTVLRIVRYVAQLDWINSLVVALAAVEVFLVALISTQWVVKHFEVLFEVFGWSKISVAARISSDEYMIMCYICANFVLAMCMIFVMSHPSCLYIQTAVATVMILCPGRVARRNAVQLDFALESKKVFVQYISHEARAPLQVANMGLELHMRELQAAVVPDSAESISFQSGEDSHQWFYLRYQHINEIVDACTTAQSTLNDMLTYDKIESGMLQMEKQTIPIFQFVSAELRSFSIQARYKNIDLAWDRKDAVHETLEFLTILGDKHKISQAFRNIMSNALKSTPANGKVSVRVRVMRLAPISPKTSPDSGILRSMVNSIPIPSFGMRVYSDAVSDFNEADVSQFAYDAEAAKRGELYCRIEVSDTGTETVQSHLSYLFSQSENFDPADFSQGGSVGLSFWLTKNIIELHGGRVGASSGGVDGTGSIFYVDMPLNLEVDSPDVEKVNGGGGSYRVAAEAVPAMLDGLSVKNAARLRPAIDVDDDDGEPPSAKLRTITRDDLWRQHEELERLKNTVLVQAMLSTGRSLPTTDAPAPTIPKNKVAPISSADSTSWSNVPSSYSGLPFSSHTISSCATFEGPGGAETSVGGSVDIAPLININSDCLHVLIVDDMAMNRKILCKALGQLDCHVICTEAVDGTEAVEIMANSVPSHPYLSALNGANPSSLNLTGIYYDIILIDSHMVTMNGPEAAEQIRSKCGYTGFIYGVTGDMSGSDDFKAKGADDVFPKPLRFDALKDIIYDYRSKLLNQLQLLKEHTSTSQRHLTHAAAPGVGASNTAGGGTLLYLEK